MQTAVDCNGSTNSNSNSNNSSATISTTIITTTQAERKNDAPTAATMTMTQQRTGDHHDEAPTSVLRHRVTVPSNSYGAIKAPKNGLSHLIDASDYLGSSVECMSLTPSPSPQASPSKRDKCKMDTLDLAGSSVMLKTLTTSLSSPSSLSPSPESCSSSKTTSNSTSTTSSVIATPILKRNGNVFKDQEEKEMDNTKNYAQAEASVAGEGGGGGNGMGSVAKVSLSLVPAGDAPSTFRECSKQQKQQQPILTNQMLPFENTSSIANKQELSSGPSLTQTMSSSTTSSSITTNASNASSVSSSPTSSPSTSSATPASATTPALLSPSSATTASSSSSCSLTSPSPSPSASASAATIKDFPISDLVDADLLQWQDMPQYLQFNPYVLKGYRPLQTFKGCLLSLFYWHNETINILTHGKWTIISS